MLDAPMMILTIRGLVMRRKPTRPPSVSGDLPGLETSSPLIGSPRTSEILQCRCVEPLTLPADE